MAFTQYTNLDFDQIKESIKDYLRANSNFTDFDFEGSNLSVLVDTLAYNTYITAYNTNAVVNEVFIDTAVLRENVVSLARNIGYVPRSKRAASAKVSFLAEVPANNTTPTLTLKAGVVVTGGASDLSYTFAVPQDITVPVTDYDGTNPRYASFDNIDIYEGNYVKSSFVVNTSVPDQKFVLPNTDIDTSTLVVKVSTTENDTVATTYKRVDSIIGISTNVYSYFLQEVSGEKYELIFGDNILLRSLTNGNYIDCSYIVTNGKEANGSAQFAFAGILEDSVGTIIAQDSALDVVTENPASNGDSIESVESIKNYAPRLYAAQYRAVSANDYEAIIPQIYENTESVTAYGGEELDPPQYGKVFIVVKPRNGEIISDYTKRELLILLKKYSVAGIVPEFVDLKYLYVELESSVYYNPNFTGTATDLLSKVTSALDTYSRTLAVNKFGGRIKYSKVVSIIDGISEAITSNITKVKIRRNLRPQIDQNAQYELCYGNKFHSRFEGYTIKSTGFTVFGNSDTLYLSDEKIDDNSGRIFFFKLDASGQPVVVKRNAGTVDYARGEIIIDTVNITSTVASNDIIEIQAIPESNDVVGLKDLYVQLNISSSKLTMVPDNISSGDNTSGTRFVPTSSFINGLYTR